MPGDGHGADEFVHLVAYGEADHESTAYAYYASRLARAPIHPIATFSDDAYPEDPAHEVAVEDDPFASGDPDFRDGPVPPTSGARPNGAAPGRRGHEGAAPMHRHGLSFVDDDPEHRPIREGSTTVFIFAGMPPLPPEDEAPPALPHVEADSPLAAVASGPQEIEPEPDTVETPVSEPEPEEAASAVPARPGSGEGAPPVPDEGAAPLIARLPPSVLTSADRFMMREVPPVPPRAGRHWASALLIFGLSASVSIVGGSLTLLHLQGPPPWLRETLRSISGEAGAAVPPSPLVSTGDVPPPATRQPSSAPDAPSHRAAGIEAVEAPPPQSDTPPRIEASAPTPQDQALSELRLAPVAAPWPIPTYSLRSPRTVASPEPALTSMRRQPAGPAPAGEAAEEPHSRNPAVVRHRAAPKPRSEPASGGTHAVRSPRERREFRSDELDAINARAESLLASGEITAARLTYRSAVAAGDPRGARGLARTFEDPQFESDPSQDRERAAYWSRIAAALEARQQDRR